MKREQRKAPAKTCGTIILACSYLNAALFNERYNFYVIEHKEITQFCVWAKIRPCP
jgi:hypothetical protein